MISYWVDSTQKWTKDNVTTTFATKDVKDVIDSWDGSTAMVVKEAIKDLTAVKASDDLIEF